MRILALSDVHCNWDRFPVDQMPDADCCVVAGDLTDWGKRRQWSEYLSSVCFMEGLAEKYTVVFWIPGNHELDVTPFEYDVANRVIGLYGKLAWHGKVFQGVSCSPCYDMPGLAEQWDYMTADPAKEKAVYESLEACDVLVSHCPPHGHLDNAGYVIGEGEVHIGSRELAAYIERHKPKLVICGHVHGQGGKESWIGETRIVNVARTWKLLEV